MRLTGGAVELTDHVPAADAPAVARLRRGAVVFGKTNVPRWSGDLQTYNEIFGTTNNPWDPARCPGGSSGGAAAAVASGLTSFELGTDIGGSVRIPAHCCGVFGLKTTYGVVPQRGYLDRVGGGVSDPDINVLGPLARSANDLALLLDVVAGPLDEDAVGWRLELPAPRATTLADYRVGVWLDEPGAPLGAEPLPLPAAVDALANAGARVEEVHPSVAFDEQVTLFMEAVGAAVSPSMDPALGEVVAGGHLNWLHAPTGARPCAGRGPTGSTPTTCCCARLSRSKHSRTTSRATSSTGHSTSTASTVPTRRSSAGPGSSASWACRPPCPPSGSRPPPACPWGSRWLLPGTATARRSSPPACWRTPVVAATAFPLA